MEHVEPAKLKSVIPDQPVVEKPRLSLEREDVGDLEQVLRGYYLAQIKKIEVRKERKLARKLLENHLVLPKSRQRTSKDAAYIQEMLGIENLLLEQLEQSRLIRRLNKTGGNPIYEISHDTLVEPILAERSNREAIALFLKKYGKFFLLLLLLIFGFGMFFENVVDVMDDSLAWNRNRSPQSVSLQAENSIYARKGTNLETIRVPFGQVQEYRGNDSVTLLVEVEVNSHPELDKQTGPDTLAVNLGPVPLSLPLETLQALIQAGKDTAIPMSAMIPLGNQAPAAEAATPAQLLASVRGTALLRLGKTEADQESSQTELPKGAGEGEPTAEGAAEDLSEPANQELAESTDSPDAGSASVSNQRVYGSSRGGEMIATDLGKQMVRAGKTVQSVSLDTVISLADLVKDDQIAYDVMKDRKLRLTYQVEVAPATQTPAVQYLPVAGIEVQYPDGTKRFIPSSPGSGNQPVSHTVRPGETLYKISKLYGVTDAEIRRLNNLTNNKIKVGQVLKIR